MIFTKEGGHKILRIISIDNYNIFRVLLEGGKIYRVLYSNVIADGGSNEIRKAIEELNIEGNLKREISGNIKRLKDIKSYRGTRHMKGLPTRGQRTKVNSRTVRGNVRRTMGSGRRKLEKT